MMSEICGKWRLVSAEKVAEYCDAIGCSPVSKEKALQFLMPENNIIQDISIQDNAVTIATTVPTKSIEVKAVLGKTTDVTFMDGRKLQTVFTVDNGKLREEQSGAFVSINVRYRDGDNLVLTMTCNGITTTRTYERVL